jgi:pilus assembly protein CpaE
MAHLVGLIISEDAALKKHATRLLRSGSVPVTVSDDRTIRPEAPADVIVIDARGDAGSALVTIERLRSVAPSAAIFAIANAADPDLILKAMRAGANEFLVWPLADQTFQQAVRRIAARLQTSSGSQPNAIALLFFGVKGGAGTTTLAVNCAVELARLAKRSTVVVDLKPGLGEVSLFLGVRPKYTILDAIDNLARLDSEFLRQLVVKHKSGIDILSGSDHFDRPGPSDAAAIEELFRLLSKQYEYMVIDAGSQMNACAVVALYRADRVFLVANPDVACVRNAQRLIERVRELRTSGDRIRLLLNRAQEPYPIPPQQIEAALGHPIHHTFPSDYKTVSTALNSGVPLALAGNSDIAAQFVRFTQRLLDPKATVKEAAPAKRSMLGIDRIASLW